MEIDSPARLATALYLSLLSSEESAVGRDTDPKFTATVLRKQMEHYQQTMKALGLPPLPTSPG